MANVLEREELSHLTEGEKVMHGDAACSRVAELEVLLQEKSAAVRFRIFIISHNISCLPD